MLNFPVIPVGYRLATKELFFAMLSGDLPPGEPRPKLATIRSIFNKIRVFLAWLETRPPQPGRPARLRLDDLIGQDLLDYRRHLKATVRNAGTRAVHRSAVRYFWRFRAVLPADRLPFDPQHLEGWTEPAHKPAENATDRIPEQVHGPLLGWAVRFIDEFAEDILAADSAWRELRDPSRRAPKGTTSGAREKVRARLADYLARGRPLPGYQGAVNIQHLAAESGCHRGACDRIQAEIDAAVAVVGISEQSPLDIPITGTLDDQPWVEGIVVDHNAANGLGCSARIL